MLLAALMLATVFPCKDGTPEHAAAAKALQRIHTRVTALAPDGDPKPLWKEIEDLPALSCFAGASHERTWLRDPESALALKEWWEAGGHSWLSWYLDAAESPGRVVIPPDVRVALTSETPGKGDLAALLCPADEAKPCGDETRGWQRRARDAFRLHAFENGRAKKPAHGSGAINATPPECMEAKGEDAPGKWREWRACAEASRDKAAMLPLGRTRAPVEGWLVVRGRRGHYNFCDEVRVYDLATGAAWIAQSCGGLVLVNDGRVDGKATDAARKPTARAGRVSLDAIREAAWMALLSPEVQAPAVEWAQWIDIPPGVTPAWPDPGEGGSMSMGLGMGFWMTSAQTQLRVTWKRRDAAPVARDLTWPESADPAEDHAVSLLAIADDTFAEGCPPAALPATVAANAGAPGVGSLDAPGGVAVTQDALVQSLLELAPASVNARSASDGRDGVRELAPCSDR